MADQSSWGGCIMRRTFCNCSLLCLAVKGILHGDGDALRLFTVSDSAIASTHNKRSPRVFLSTASPTLVQNLPLIIHFQFSFLPHTFHDGFRE
jgi:hypothetical protein